MATIAQLLRQGSQALASVSQSPNLDTELLLAHALNKPRAHLHAWPEKRVEDPLLSCFHQLLQRRLQGEPIAYLLGTKEFWSREFYVNSAVLIPRPETELLVEHTLALIPKDCPVLVADLGTGSGAIALTLGLERPNIQVVATDRSLKALKVASENVQRHRANNVHLCQANWLSSFRPSSFDLIVSNPPYIAPDDPHLNRGDVRFEPRSALAADKNGLAALQTIGAQARRCLKPGGWLIVEHGWDQRPAVARIFESLGYQEVTCFSDWQNHPRVTRAQWSS
ncbi:MAG: hypothetical protein AXA67_05075 [Methylothermaceae bacteria B42]|nr:MAG: hypothetical protein AXA67_05075 [Methylothermaceae bacteria B42]HHJ39883.1 peptide chain release factor N(5)-glutamine methyltransferase [Methylothermaceae bacterium]